MPVWACVRYEVGGWVFCGGCMLMAPGPSTAHCPLDRLRFAQDDWDFVAGDELAAGFAD